MRKTSTKLLSPIWFLLKTYSKEILVTVLPVAAILLWGNKIWLWSKSIYTQKVTIPEIETAVSALAMIVLASLIVPVLTFYLGYKIKDLKKSKIRYIDFNKFIWRIQRIKDTYTFRPLCMADCTALNLIPLDKFGLVYCYKCEWCGETYSVELVQSEEHAIESKINDFGIKYFRNRLVNIKQRVKPLVPRSNFKKPFA